MQTHTKKSIDWGDIIGPIFFSLLIVLPILCWLSGFISGVLQIAVEYHLTWGLAFFVVVVWVWIMCRKSKQAEAEEESARRLEKHAYELGQLTKQQALQLHSLQERILELEQDLARKTTKVQPYSPIRNLFTPTEHKLLILALDQGAAPGEWTTAVHKLFSALRNRRIDAYAMSTAAP
jgi:hypothetical protein